MPQLDIVSFFVFLQDINLYIYIALIQCFTNLIIFFESFVFFFFPLSCINIIIYIFFIRLLQNFLINYKIQLVMYLYNKCF